MTSFLKMNDNFFDEFDLLWRDVFNSQSKFSLLSEHKINYPIDVIENDKGLKLQVAAVGLERDDISIDIDDDTLKISYAKNEERTTDTYLYRGITRKSFSYAWKIARKYDISKIEASLDKGLLTIDIPLNKEKETKKIAIN